MYETLLKHETIIHKGIRNKVNTYNNRTKAYKLRL